MKKTLLFTIVFMLPFFMMAQTSNLGVGKIDKMKLAKTMKADAGYFYQAGPVNNNKSGKGLIQDVAISSSVNIYSVLVEQQSCLTANPDLNMIMFTHRHATTGGDIVNSYSTDGGLTWTNFLNVSNTKANRYPSGQIYNPSGNTNPNNAFGLVCGPTTNGSLWTENYFASKKFDGTNGNVYSTLSSSHEELIRNGLVICGNKAHVLGGTYISTAPYTFLNMLMMNGTFNTSTNKFDWTCDTITNQFVIGSDGNEDVYFGSWNTAWSKDGQVGYTWVLGRDSATDVRSFQPVIWKTINGGSNWNKMPVYDFSANADIQNYLYPMSNDTVRPQFTSAIDGVVDFDGQLHFFAKVRGASSNHDDSLGYYWIVRSGGEPLFHFWTSDNGWQGNVIAGVYTKEVDDDESFFTGSDGGLGWDLRIQAGRSVDGKKVFASWTDTDTNLAVVSNNYFINSFPNIFVYGYNTTTSSEIGLINATEGSTVDGDCYFHFMSDVILDYPSDPNSFIVPLTKTSLGTAPENSANHRYLKGVVLGPSAVNSSENSIVTVSQNRPNPSTSSTSIDVNLNKASNLSIEVTNIVGQKVFEANYGKVSAGSSSYQISTSSMKPGIYFYTVIAGNAKTTKKMIVQ